MDFFAALTRLLRLYWKVPVEALSIFGFTMAPLAIAEFYSRATMPEKALLQTTWISGVLARFSLSDIFVFSTGVLGTTAMYFVFKPRLVKRFLRLIFTGLLFPFLVVFSSAIVHSALTFGSDPPNSYLTRAAVFVAILMLISWLTVLIEIRNMENIDLDIDNDARSREMQKQADPLIG